MTEQEYRDFYGIPEGDQVIHLIGDDGSDVFARKRDGQFFGGWIRIYPNGRHEAGMLWGGDVWEPVRQPEGHRFGRWHVHEVKGDKLGNHFRIADDAGKTVAIVSMIPFGHVVAKRHAELIAAIPFMLEALENLENDNGKTMPDTAWELVQIALREAGRKHTGKFHTSNFHAEEA